MNLLEKKDLIDMNPMHIATVNENGIPNLSVASDVKVISENKILISHNEMINTPKNILKNENIVLTTFNKHWEGLRITGTANYYTSGKYFELDIQLFRNKNTNPLGAIVVTVKNIEKIK